MPIVWKDLNPVAGVRVAGSPGALCLAFPGARFGAAASAAGAALALAPGGAPESLRVVAGPVRKKPKASAYVIATGEGEKPDSAEAKAARKAAQETGWLDAISRAKAAGFRGTGVSRRCFVEFIPTVVNCIAFTTAAGPAAVAVTDAPMPVEVAREVARQILCEHAGKAAFAAVVASGAGEAAPSRTEAVAAMIRAAADTGLRAMGA